MKYGRYVVMLAKVAFSSSLAIGLVIGVALLISGGAHGQVTFDIDLSASDSLWFFIGIPILVTALFVLVSPLSVVIFAAVSRKEPSESQ